MKIQHLQSIEDEICKVLSPVKSLRLPLINRGADVNTYYPTVDDLLIQYDFDRYRKVIQQLGIMRLNYANLIEQLHIKSVT